MDEIYNCVSGEVIVQLKIEGSRFIGEIFPVTTEHSALSVLESVRKKYFDATHHCYSYVIGADKKNVRYSDDGEPNGTAGVKINTAILSKNLSDVLLVVTRYFGGTKLGVGGLGRAYFDTAEAVIDRATMIRKAIVKEVSVSFPFSETNPVMNIINTNRLKIGSTSYADERTIISLFLLPSQVSSIMNLFTNATRGSAEINIGEISTMVWQ